MARLDALVDDEIEGALIALLHDHGVRHDDYRLVQFTTATVIHVSGRLERQQRIDQIVYRSLSSDTRTDGNRIQNILLHVQEAKQLLEILEVFLLLAPTPHCTEGRRTV